MALMICFIRHCKAALVYSLVYFVLGICMSLRDVVAHYYYRSIYFEKAQGNSLPLCLLGSFYPSHGHFRQASIFLLAWAAVPCVVNPCFVCIVFLEATATFVDRLSGGMFTRHGHNHTSFINNRMGTKRIDRDAFEVGFKGWDRSMGSIQDPWHTGFHPRAARFLVE